MSRRRILMQAMSALSIHRNIRSMSTTLIMSITITESLRVWESRRTIDTTVALYAMETITEILALGWIGGGIRVMLST
jgi:hypothetical protein